jgi:hypothetical protein
VARLHELCGDKFVSAGPPLALVRQPHFVMRCAVGVGPGGGTISRGLGGVVARGSTAGGGVRAGAGG